MSRVLPGIGPQTAVLASTLIPNAQLFAYLCQPEHHSLKGARKTAHVSCGRCREEDVPSLQNLRLTPSGRQSSAWRALNEHTHAPAGSEDGSEQAEPGSPSIAHSGGWSNWWWKRHAAKEQVREERRKEKAQAAKVSRPPKGAVWSLFSWASSRQQTQKHGLHRSGSDLFDKHSGQFHILTSRVGWHMVLICWPTCHTAHWQHCSEFGNIHASEEEVTLWFCVQRMAPTACRWGCLHGS